jgi:hypothetical protein
MIQDGLKIYVPYYARYVAGGTFTQEIVNWIDPTETITKSGAGLDTGEPIAMIQGSGMLIPALAKSDEPIPTGGTGWISPLISLQSGK